MGNGQRGPRSRNLAPSQESVCSPLRVQRQSQEWRKKLGQGSGPAVLLEGLETWAQITPQGLFPLNSGKTGLWGRGRGGLVG